jgi:hypothetical protein
MPEDIDISLLKRKQYSGLVRVLAEKGGRLVQAGYLMLVEGKFVEGVVEEKGRILEGNGALGSVEDGGYKGVFEPPIHGRTDDLLGLAMRRDVLKRLDRDY